MAAVDYFLKLDNIDGESTDDFHKGEIEISSFSWGATNSGAFSHGGGGGAGKVQMQDFHFAMDTSQASPVLMLACATGQHIKLATLTVRKAGGESRDDFLKITLTDVIVSSFDFGGDSSSLVPAVTPAPSTKGSGGGGGTGVPTEAVSFNFTKIEWTYRRQAADGSVVVARSGWDLKKGTKI